ncbi:hypothetical protein ACFFQW_32955 [Umezawaea endophytica]|uniref:Uncharacterized protein n=1 Tax=Umezawaea endophytica TaxID=1654476 RepID=A0A9X3AK10_9PSEU|nr:hypothetical protein [Umezawaea endophytica]MCS7482250.1 hypothetical protein [Umezawaea endophytica]
MVDWAGSADSGKHRLHERVAGWPHPECEPRPTAHTRPSAGPGQVPAQRGGRPVPDPLVDSDGSGLRKFNIGLVPASVTPPRTWKRAAWFAVASSGCVLVGLAIAAAKLVGSSGPVERIGMPEYPAAVPIVTDFGTRTSTPSAGSPAPDTRPQAPGRASTTAAAPSSGAAPSSSASSSGSTSGGAGPTTATSPGAPSTTSPTVTTVPSQEQPLVDSTAIAGRTEKFYEELAANTETAMALTTEAFRSDTEALLEQRFADVSLIEVKEISVDPSKGITISTLQITRKDGTASTEQRELTFTLSGNPLINAERLAAIG